MFEKKETINLKFSYLLYFKEKKSWDFEYKFKYGFSIALCKKTKQNKKQFFLILRKKDNLGP